MPDRSDPNISWPEQAQRLSDVQHSLESLAYVPDKVTDKASTIYDAVLRESENIRDFTHQLITRVERARVQQGIGVGDRVWFGHEGVRYTGIVKRITKRATVLVEHEQGVLYSDGKRYAKFYVPVSMLERLEE